MSSTSPITLATGSALDKSQTPAVVVFKDGFLAPFLEIEQRVFQDPDFGPNMSPRPVTILSPRLTATTPFWTGHVAQVRRLVQRRRRLAARLHDPSRRRSQRKLPGRHDHSAGRPRLLQREVHVANDSFRRQRRRIRPQTYATGQLTENWALQPPIPAPSIHRIRRSTTATGGESPMCPLPTDTSSRRVMSSRRCLCGTATGSRCRLGGSPGSTSKTLASLGSTTRRYNPSGDPTASK